ncbi:hypothetical protein MJO28_007609 [Puccinia striiformis f. sp. tritici]|uniref:Uncharacterized protein n=4 Tax=Puccinia striiformis TaxID=27350 RepID=A0A0L0VS23_9BASI|nr:hypothetical protein MJO28_007609 [Puccinia striiformis f. sp. tritici]KAI9612836.1 hypothetical protein KEM48_004072 [Puccinia striiformis f. sp. tritici PST-130]KNF02069.1 hypothetical protein PSTG_04567 [Puccinia striiformis f. sp. tritici PST-78]POW09444.1 hypothetical protein PSTT_06817 [Puccinia striiformis]
MIPLNMPRSRSSTGSSCGFHELAPTTLLRPTDAEPNKHHGGRRLSKMRNMISTTLTKSHSQYQLGPSTYTQTLPASRPKVRRTISRSMIAPLQHLFGVDHQESELEDAERYESQPWSLTVGKAGSNKIPRRGPTTVLYQPTLSDDEEWDFRCQGMAPVIPARPSEDALSPSSAYSHSFLGSPGYIGDPGFFHAASSASSCCSSPGPCHIPARSFSADNGVKKQKISVDSISGPLNLWSPRSLSPLLAPPPPRTRNQLGLEVKT